MFRYLPLILKNGLRNRRRSLLTVLSIAASMCLLGVLAAIYFAFYVAEATPEAALRLVVRHKVSITNVMPMSYRAKIAGISGVREVLPTQWFGGVYKDNRPENQFARFAADEKALFTVYPEYRLPEEQKQAFWRDRAGCIVGQSLAVKYGWKLGDRVVLAGDIFPGKWEWTIRGIYESATNNDILYFHMENLYEGIRAGRDFAGMYGVLIDSPDSAPRIIREIDEMFRNSTQPTKTDTEQNFTLAFISMLGDLKTILMAICAAITFTVVLVSANTMAMSARERVREVGILKTLGFTNRAVLGMILGEAAFLSLLGGALGFVLASSLTSLVRNYAGFFDQLKTLTVPLPVGVALVVFAALIGVISSLVPAWSAARTSILESIRYTG